MLYYTDSIDLDCYNIYFGNHILDIVKVHVISGNQNPK